MYGAWVTDGRLGFFTAFRMTVTLPFLRSQESINIPLALRFFLDSRPRITCGASFTGMTMARRQVHSPFLRRQESINVSLALRLFLDSRPRIKCGASFTGMTG